MVSQKYNLLFYIRKIDFSTKEVGLVIAICKNSTNKIIFKTNAEVISISELHNELMTFRDQLSLFNYDMLDNLISCSFLNGIVEININSSKLDRLNLSDQPKLVANYIFKSNKKTNRSNDYSKFTTTTTVNNILSFIVSVESYLINIK